MEAAFLIFAASARQLHQIEPQYADSFNKAAHWWVWYYAGMVVTPSQMLSVMYLLTPTM